ncbi:GGDEF domain-containing protein [Mangrovitalea sediminis]|uniref:GGDEF domain-containing protein n=1 Tax=Mangrovitalea sediminis TaxID=1982043 RepID=UPI000BE4C6EE|nr:GGDEF domain-containing protein [Mangrovitalea sediminis]
MFAIDAIHGIIDDEAVSTWFQPIVHARNGDIMAYEALSRGPSNSPLHAPLIMIEAAERVGRLGDLEQACVRAAVSNFCAQGLQGRLFLNVGPESLLDPQFQNGHTRALLEKYGMRSEQIVIELTEHRPLSDIELVKDAIRHFKSLGFAIALDDLGAGYASLQLWSELHPDFVKIDRHFITRIDEDPVKREFVRSIIEIARTLNCQVIAEGIETAGEYAALRGLGVDFLQGYFIERPLPQPPLQIPAERLAKVLNPEYRHDHSVGILCVEREPVALGTPVLDIAARFRDAPVMNALAVVEGDRPVGIVYRHKLLDVLSRPYALDLFAKKTVERVMEKAPLIVESDWRLDQVSRLVTARARLYREDDFLIVDHGRYRGMGQVIDLLKHITEMQMQTARHANPLTLLPGTIPLHEVLDQLLVGTDPFVVCYFDLNHFKPYNDVYGYARGDEVLLHMARMLRQSLVDECEFLAHVGGDDFIGVYRRQDWRDRVESLVMDFADAAASFYSESQRQAGGFWATDRYGEKRFHPLLSLAAGGLEVTPGDYDKAADLAAVLSGVKRAAKRVATGSVVVWNASSLDQAATVETGTALIEPLS